MKKLLTRSILISTLLIALFGCASPGPSPEQQTREADQQREAERQQKKFEMLARKKSDVTALPLFEEGAETRAMLDEIDMRAAHLEKIEADVREWEKKGAKATEAQLKSRAAEIAKALATTHAAKGNVVAEVKDADAKLLQAVGDALKSKIKGPIFLAGAANGRVALLAVVKRTFSPET